MGSSAKTSRRASVTEHGLLPFRRTLTCSIVVALSYEKVTHSAKICLGQVLEGLSPPGPGSPGHPETTVSTRHWPRVLRVAVEPEVSGAYRRRPGPLAHLHWHASRRRWLFPEMEADLLARPLGPNAELVLDASYEPPGGLLGVLGDVVVGRLVARSTAAAFTSHLAQAMEEAVAEGRCTTPTPEHTRDEVSQ